VAFSILREAQAVLSPPEAFRGCGEWKRKLLEEGKTPRKLGVKQLSPGLRDSPLACSLIPGPAN